MKHFTQFIFPFPEWREIHFSVLRLQNTLMLVCRKLSFGLPVLPAQGTAVLGEFHDEESPIEGSVSLWVGWLNPTMPFLPIHT